AGIIQRTLNWSCDGADDVLRGRGRPGRHGARIAAGALRSTGDRAGEARRLPAGLPRGHGAPYDLGPAGRTGAGRAVRTTAAAEDRTAARPRRPRRGTAHPG